MQQEDDMNLNQIINMIMRTVMRRLVNSGINAGMNAVTNRKKAPVKGQQNENR
jgi:hypothetical protein